MRRTAPAEVADLGMTDDAAARPLPVVIGDIRDRLATLLNAAQIIRLTRDIDDADLLTGLRLMEEQVRCLGRLADELYRDPEAQSAPMTGHGWLLDGVLGSTATTGMNGSGEYSPV